MNQSPSTNSIRFRAVDPRSELFGSAEPAARLWLVSLMVEETQPVLQNNYGGDKRQKTAWPGPGRSGPDSRCVLSGQQLA